MHVRNQPLSLELAKTKSLAEPYLRFCFTLLRPCDSDKSVTITQVIAGMDFQIADIIADGPLESGKPLFQILLERHGALQRRRQVKSHRVGCEMRKHTVHVLFSDG